CPWPGFGTGTRRSSTRLPPGRKAPIIVSLMSLLCAYHGPGGRRGRSRQRLRAFGPVLPVRSAAASAFLVHSAPHAVLTGTDGPRQVQLSPADEMASLRCQRRAQADHVAT